MAVMQLQQPTRVRIEAPDALTAFELERRLVFWRPTAIARHDRWFVELETDETRLDELGVAVKHWLADERIAETVLHTDNRARHVRAA